LAAEEMLSNGN
jgi:uncharacterized protein YecA (UPF0149 family)